MRCLGMPSLRDSPAAESGSARWRRSSRRLRWRRTAARSAPRTTSRSMAQSVLPTVYFVKTLFYVGKSGLFQRSVRIHLDRRPLFLQLVETLERARADLLIRLADLAADVRQLIDEHLILVRTGLRDETVQHALKPGLVAAFLLNGLPHARRKLARFGQLIANLETELRLLGKVRRGDTVFRHARIDLHDDRFGLRHTARREPRSVSARRHHRPAAAKSAALHVAAARRRSTRVPQIPDEAVHPDFRRQRGWQAAATPAAP